MNVDSSVDRFLALEGSDVVLDTFRIFIAVFALPAETAGINWGVTVPKRDRGARMRLNAHNQQLFSATWFPREGWHCHVMAPDTQYAREAAARPGLSASRGQRAQPYPDQLILSGRTTVVAALLRDSAFGSTHSEFVSTYAARRLWRSSWSNAEVVELILGEQGRLLTPSEITSRSESRTGGVTYKPATAFDISTDIGQTFNALAVAQGSQQHVDLQNGLAELIRQYGFVPLSPAPEDPKWDVAFRGPDDRIRLVEVKSLTADNEVHQLRLGLGQALEYRSRVEEPAEALLYVERPPSDPHWHFVCQHVGVALVHPASIDEWLIALREMTASGPAPEPGDDTT